MGARMAQGSNNRVDGLIWANSPFGFFTAGMLLALISCCEDGRERRPYKRSGALAAAGVEEFEFTMEEVEEFKSLESAAEVEVNVELNAAETTSVQQHMISADLGGPAGPATKKQKTKNSVKPSSKK